MRNILLLPFLLLLNNNVYSQTIPSDNIHGGTENGIIGKIPSELEVTPNGQLLYDISIAVAPGTGGITPQLSVAYNSSNGDGLFGHGFELKGLSLISRMPENLYRDGHADVIRFDSSDRFALDGVRLSIREKGEGRREYRTETNNYSKIIAFGDSASPSSFIVYAKDGTIHEYTPACALVGSSGNNLFWLETKVTDTKGNYYSIIYDGKAEANEFFPVRIDYTGNESASLTPFASVRFEYENAPATSTSYISGVKVCKTKHINSICCYNGDQLIRKYSITYSSKLGKHFITQICESAGDEKKNPTSFSWNNSDSLNVSCDISSSDEIFKNRYIITGDFNGDGKTDFYARANNNNKDLNYYLYISNGSSFNDPVCGQLVIPQEEHPDYNRINEIKSGDFNGDGYDDIVVERANSPFYAIDLYLTMVDADGGVSMKYTKTVVPIVMMEHTMTVMDNNVDGAADLFVQNKNIGFTSYCVLMSQSSEEGVMPLAQQYSGDLSGDTWNGQNASVLLDLDGDGSREVLIVHEDRHSTLHSISSAGELKKITDLTLKATDYFCVGDFNGDGKTDILTMGTVSNPNSGWEMNFSTGCVGKDSKIFDFYNVPMLFSAKEKSVYVADVNGDGFDDLYVICKSSDNGKKKPLDIYINDGTGKAFVHHTGADVFGGDKRVFRFGDFNGDGKADFICYAKLKDATPGYDLFTVTNGSNNLLTGITDGLGNAINVGYKYLTDNSVHTRGKMTDYPLVSVNCPWSVVNHISIPDGTGGHHDVDYKYKNLILHKHGRGVLGFEQVEKTDNTLGMTTVNCYEASDAEKVPMLKSTKTYLNDRLLNETEYTNIIEYQLKEGSKEVSFTCRPIKTVERTFEYNSGVKTSEIETICAYDEYGNVTESIVKNGLNKITTINTYSNDEDKWILGRLTKAVVTKEGDNTGSVVVTSEYEYDSTSGLLLSEKLEPGNPVGYEKTYTYDKYGNILEDVIIPNDGYDKRHTYTVYGNDGRFVIQSENSLGYVSSSSVDSNLGVVTESTDINGLKTTYLHNAFGELLKTTSPFGTSTITTAWSKGHEYAPELSLYYVKTETTGEPTQWEFFDCLGRTVRIAMTGRRDRVIYTDIVYNNKGQIIKKSEPYFKGDAPIWNTIEYDDVERVVKETKAGGGITSFCYDGLTTTVTDPLGNTTSKTFDMNGNIVQSTDALGNSVTFKYNVNGKCVETVGPRTTIKLDYDILGNRTRLDDPDLGTIEYRYNSFGELVLQKDSKGEQTFEYDKCGRLVMECRPDYTYTHVYDTEWKGALSVSECSNGMSHSYSYDRYGRLVGEQEQLEGKTFNTSYNYNAINKVDVITYPSGFQVKNNYSDNGFLLSVTSNDSKAKVFWKAEETNARGQIETEEFGNGVKVSTSYNNTGTIQKTSVPGIFSKSYVYDALNNLQSRTDDIRSLTENFEHDALYRLTRASDNKEHEQCMKYDGAGNIVYKTELGEITYTDGTNRISSVVDGSRILTGWSEIEYSSFNKITKAKLERQDRHFILSDEMYLLYGADKTRKVERIIPCRKSKSIQNPADNCNTPQRTKYYVGKLYEKEETDADVKEKNYIFADGKAIAFFETSHVSDGKAFYMHHDHLGSVIALTDESGHLYCEYSYDAWGRRRNPDTWDFYSFSADSIAEYDRGFTGHEHIDLFDMVNMEGRMYDPVMGRFLSPDPYVQMPDFTQSLNRYAYCVNNPLSLTDPTGYNWMGDLMATAVGVAVGLETCGLGAGIAGAIIGGALGGASSSLVGAVFNGANLWQTTKGVFTGAFWGAASASIDFQIGEINNVFERIAAHSVSEGFVEGIRGGHFEHGMLVGFASSTGGEFISRYGNSMPYVGKIAANAALGGCVSVLGGGKFANGAMTAAYTMMFNDLMHDGDDGDNEKSSSIVTSELEERGGVYYLNGHIIGEKPMESIWPEFDILTGLCGALNTIVSFSTNAKAITAFLNGNHFTRLKGGVRQAFIERTDINKLFRSLASKCNAKIHYNGTEEYFKVGKYRVGLHNSSHGGGKTMHINFNNREKLYKIRSK